MTRATLETVARQASIPEAERRSWIAGAKWGLAQGDVPEPQPRLPVAALIGGTEWKAPLPVAAPESNMKSEAEVRAEIERRVLAIQSTNSNVGLSVDRAVRDVLRWVLNEQETGR